jgi:hypothetical protein
MTPVESTVLAKPKSMSPLLFDDGDWNADVVEDLEAPAYEMLQLFSRDWTFETIASQMEQRNIDLDPAFQRRNVWTDERRSKLIESLIVGIPVPQVFLAEDRERKRSFIVLDGKQRLLTIAGFLDPELDNWDNGGKLCKLKIRKDLNGKSYADLTRDFSKELRLLRNADIRCAVISNYEKDDVLYHIFNRLNTTAVALSTQELRQVLHRGPFARYLAEFTDQPLPLHSVMLLDQPDNRLRDTEIVLRFLSMSLFGSDYKGNLKTFLDSSMDKLNKGWDKGEALVIKASADFNKSVELLSATLGADKVGRKMTDGVWETRFNKALFEVEAFYFAKLSKRQLDAAARERFKRGFSKLCDDTEFRETIESSTKNRDRYKTRFALFQRLVNQVFKTHFRSNPF